MSSATVTSASVSVEDLKVRNSCLLCLEEMGEASSSGEKVSLRNLVDYFRINCEGIQDGIDVKGLLCSNCSRTCARFSELWELQKEVDVKMKKCLKGVKKRLGKAGKDSVINKNFRKNQQDAEVVKNLRTALMTECRSKTSTSRKSGLKMWAEAESMGTGLDYVSTNPIGFCRDKSGLVPIYHPELTRSRMCTQSDQVTEWELQEEFPNANLTPASATILPSLDDDDVLSPASGSCEVDEMWFPLQAKESETMGSDSGGLSPQTQTEPVLEPELEEESESTNVEALDLTITPPRLDNDENVELTGGDSVSGSSKTDCFPSRVDDNGGSENECKGKSTSAKQQLRIYLKRKAGDVWTIQGRGEMEENGWNLTQDLGHGQSNLNSSEPPADSNSDPTASSSLDSVEAAITAKSNMVGTTRPGRKSSSQNKKNRNGIKCTFCIKCLTSDDPYYARSNFYMMRHLKLGPELKCPWEGCSYKTTVKSSLNAHYDVHVRLRNVYRCPSPECLRYLATKYNFKIHIKGRKCGGYENQGELEGVQLELHCRLNECENPKRKHVQRPVGS